MKIRQKPEDFVVTELSRYQLASQGPFALYRLKKWDIGTIEAVEQLSRDPNPRTRAALPRRPCPGRP